MYSDIFLIVSSTLALLASAIAVNNWYSLSKGTEDRNRIIRNGIIFTAIVLTLVSLLFFEYGKEVFNRTSTPIPKEIVDISGSYIGYFINDLGQQEPTYLKIEYDEIADSIKFHFKNSVTIICNAEYEIDENIVNVIGLGKGYVKQENGFVIIESSVYQDKKWKFTKDLMQY